MVSSLKGAVVFFVGILSKIAKSGGGSDKKVVVVEIFGSNLCLSQKKVVVINQEQSPNSSVNIGPSSQKTHWAAVQAAHGLVGKMPLSCVLASLYDEARTYFQP